jgi:L-threonylcarbamoyladenylate synthase
MAFSQSLKRAARILRSGGVIAYPTEGVYGLGCLPDNFSAVSRLLAIKDRDPALGLVLIASDLEQLAGWIELPGKESALKSSNDKPVTWIVPATDEVPYWIRGEHSGLAVRMTAHPVAAALCDAADSALVLSPAYAARHPARPKFVTWSAERS